MLTRTFVVAATLFSSFGSGTCEQECKNHPLDPRWPSNDDWDGLDRSTGGALIKSRPVASSCYEGNPFGSDFSCEEVQEGWHRSAFHGEQPESINYPYWANNSCVPPNDYYYIQGQACELGGLPQYILNATTPEQIATALKWASARNIRVVIKGTGHDLNGRSSGAHALSIWTHQLQSFQFDANWQHPVRNQTEQAIIAGSGNTWGTLLKASAAVGRTVVSGQEATVGMGGFIGGGGHGPLSSHYGLAADQVLQATVVTTEGNILIANEAQNQDLLWAIRGGGPGLYGVVVEYVLRTYPLPQNVVYSTISTSIVGSNSLATNSSWDALAALSSSIPDLMDAGITGYGFASTKQVSFGNSSSTLTGVEASLNFYTYNTTATDFEAILQPVMDIMLTHGGNDTLSVAMTEPKVFPSYAAFFADQVPNGAGDVSLMSSRLLGRRELSDLPIATIRSYLEKITSSDNRERSPLLVYGLQGGPGPRQVDADMRGALNPAWREAYLHLMVTPGFDIASTDKTPQDALSSTGTWIEDNVEAVWREWAPGSGSYFNEANPFNGNFKEDYYGSSYDRLLAIKEKYDPSSSLFVLAGVGSDAWEYNLDSGKLCRKH